EIICNFPTFIYDSGMRSRALVLAIGCGIALQCATARAGDAYKVLTEIPIGGEAGWDILTVDSAARRLYLSNATKVVVVDIDAKAAKVVTTIPLDGSPEFAVADEAAGRVYCNIEDKSEVAVIDAAKHEVIEQWPLAPGEQPTGIALDAVRHRLFVGCHNKLM